MKHVVVIGGMGAGKSSVIRALAECGLPCIDLDKVGHQVHELPEVKHDLVQQFGSDVLDSQGNVVRSVVAQRAFVSHEATAALNAITLPRICMLYQQQVEALKAEGHRVVVAEFSSFRSKNQVLARSADVIIAVVAPLEQRVARAVAAGWNESDVRCRIAQQITDEERIAAADVVFENTGSLEDVCSKVRTWWAGFAPRFLSE